MSPLQWPRARKNKTVTVVDVDEESCSEFDDSPGYCSSDYDYSSCYSISGDDFEDSDFRDDYFWDDYFRDDYFWDDYLDDRSSLYSF